MGSGNGSTWEFGCVDALSVLGHACLILRSSPYQFAIRDHMLRTISGEGRYEGAMRRITMITAMVGFDKVLQGGPVSPFIIAYEGIGTVTVHQIEIGRNNENRESTSFCEHHASRLPP